MTSKFLDLLKAKDRRASGRNRLANCPYKDSCMPVSYHVGGNSAGVCAGLIYKSNNLDCIRQCIFYEDLGTKELKTLQHFMTPDEALHCIHSLALAVGVALDYASSYKEYYEALCKLRDDGDKTPSQY